MSSLQIWVCIIGGLWLGCEAVNALHAIARSMR